MRAGVPVLSAGRRKKRRRRRMSPVVPVLLLPDLELWFRLLDRLVPGLQPGTSRSSSRVEILQRVIDYILQLQTELQVPTCTAASFSLAGVRNKRLIGRHQSSSAGSFYFGSSEDSAGHRLLHLISRSDSV
ncbi:DNA-binding protein inhibitor ID-2b isoform X1 [Sebastes fasciatus]|uniref:DNA-binding protein inhibitor ID-2b isoform X1 n=1 Tax=Sebastes fasciatus TaxID=394691 RepID=UPI003D9E36D5